MQGTVTFFHTRKKYGFIETDEADDDIFFHISELEGEEEIEEGEDVEFETEEGDKGQKAVNVTKV